MVAVLEPVCDLFDGGLFEIVGERGLAGVWPGAGVVPGRGGSLLRRSD